MAMKKAPQFDTTGITTIEPGLTYATPKADESGSMYNSLGAAAGIIESAGKFAIGLDEKFTRAEARTLAEELATELEQGSLSTQKDLQNQISRVQQNLQGSVDEEAKKSYQLELEDLTEKLAKAREQNIITPFDFKMRLSAKAQELAHRNPAYTAEISNEIAKVFNIHGVSDRLSMDQSIIDSRNKAFEDDYKMKVKYLNEKRMINTTGMDFDDINSVYDSEINKEREMLVLKEYSSNAQVLNDAEKTVFEQKMKEDGGLQRKTNDLSTNMYNELILNEQSSADFNTKELNRRRIIQDYRRIIDVTASSLPSRDEYTKWHSNMTSMLNSLDAETKEGLTGARGTTYLENKKKNMLVQNEILRIVDGRDIATLTNIEKQSAIIKNLAESKYFNDTQLQEVLSQQMVDIIVNGTRQTNINNPYIQDYLRLEMSTQSNALSKVALEQIEKDGKMQQPTVKAFNNMWLETQQFRDENSLQRFEAGDKVIKDIMNIDDKIFNKLMMEEPDFARGAETESRVYKNILAQALVSPANGVLWAATENRPYQGINVNETTGRVSYSSDILIDNLMGRLNTYIAFKAKMDGTTFKQASDSVLANEFRFLTREGFAELEKNKEKIGAWSLVP